MEVMEILLNLQAELRRRDGYQITDINDIGTDIMINCPFHGEGRERTPSFGIIKEDKHTSQGKLSKGYGNCFACGAKMSLHKLVEAVLQVQPEDANDWLEASGYRVQTNELYETLTQLTPAEDKLKIPESQYTKGYIEYMSERGISPRIAEVFDLGHVTNALVIPIKDRHGVVRMLIHRFIEPVYGRKFHNTSGANKDELLHGRWELFNYPTMLKRPYLFIVESSIDMILMWQAGYATVATMQATPTAKQLEQINSIPIKNIVIATDNDEAGMKAIPRYAAGLKGKNIYRLKYLPHENDIGDLSEDRLRSLEIEQIYREEQTSLIEELPVG